MTDEQLDDRLSELFPNLDWSFSGGRGECDHFGCAECDLIDLDICLRVKTFSHKRAVEVEFGKDIEFPNIETAIEWLKWFKSTLAS